MLRRLLVVSLLAVSATACGGSSPTEAPSSEAPVTTAAPAVTASPAVEPSPSPTPIARTTVTTACGAVALRAEPSTAGKLVARIARGVKVRTVAVQTGDSYTTGSCGTAGDTWYKIDRIGSKTVKSLYGTKYVYAAAGLFQ
jgi:hypothetical protein